MAKSNVQSKKKLFESLAGPLRQRVLPARSQVAVNKSLSKITNSRKSTASALKQQSDENVEPFFADNFEMAIALLPTVPFNLSKYVRKWIAALLDPAGNTPMTKRNTFLSFLVFQMQTMKISEPFNNEPPQNLSDINRIFNDAKLRTLMAEMDKKNKIDLLRQQGLTANAFTNFRTDYKPPPLFFEDQIFPNNGIICYGGCFSNYFK